MPRSTVPVIVTSALLVQEGATLYQNIESGKLDIAAYVAQFKHSLPPYFQHLLDRFGMGELNGLREKIVKSAMQGSQVLASQAIRGVALGVVVTAVVQSLLGEGAFALKVPALGAQADREPRQLRQATRHQGRQCVVAEPEAFDGCATRGQNRPGQAQPIHIVRQKSNASQGVAA